ncbi:MAG: hypothetical protein QM811_08820 [Pirellulales bacterium]
MGNIIFGAIMIAGGLSGYVGIRGISNSGMGLAALGAGLLVWGVVQLIRGGDDED